MNTFALDLGRLSNFLAERMGGEVDNLSVLPLGESSRETPWRVDFMLEGAARTVVLRYGRSCSRNEVVALRAMEHVPLPTPRVLTWDEDGAALGLPVFVSEFIDGTSLLIAMRQGKSWALDLYLDTACSLQAIRAEDLPAGTSEALEQGQSALDVLNDAYDMMKTAPLQIDHLIDAAYRVLMDTRSDLPATEFSNGDLWPENLLVRDRTLIGIIDWQHAGFSDPVFEFLLPFFLVPELRGRGMEERFCLRKGIDPCTLDWYRGLEFFDSLRWVLKTGTPYEMHTEQSLRAELEQWLRRR